MTVADRSQLDLNALSQRLLALAGEEREAQANFLLHLDELDRRRGWAELGYPSLWEYCTRALRLREGAAARRIGAMKVLRRFPRLEGALRDGRLSLSTLRQLDLAAVLKEALKCGIEKHGKRRGAVAPDRPRAPAEPRAPSTAANEPASNRHVPAAVRREVWRRDRGRCTYVAPDGTRCGCTRKLEFDHIDAAARGGPPTLANLRLRCRSHNLLHAEQTYGVEHMALFRRTSGDARPHPLLPLRK